MVQCNKMMTFLFLKLEIFSLKLGKTHTFFLLEHNPKMVFKMCQKAQNNQENNYTPYSGQIYIARKGIFWPKFLTDSLNRMNTNAQIIFQCLPYPNKYKNYMIQISYTHMTLFLRCSLRQLF